MNDNLSNSLLEEDLLKSISGGTGENQITTSRQYRCLNCGAELQEIVVDGFPISICPCCGLQNGWTKVN